MLRSIGKQSGESVESEVVVKGTRGNEGAERNGVHDEEEWTKNRALGDTAGGCVPGRQVSYTFDTEGTR